MPVSVVAEEGMTDVATTSLVDVPLREIGFSTLAPPTIAVVQQTPTPFSTATATPTPTPIIYVIQSGDTFLGIAIDNQTTVEDIQLLNPDVRPELLSIGQEVILPPPATPIFASDQPTPLPIQIAVRSVSLYPDGAGGLWVMGEVENSADYFLEDLLLEIIIYGRNGAVVHTVEVRSAAGLITPKQSVPFGFLLPQKPAEAVQVDANLINGFAFANLGENSTHYFGMTAKNIEFDFDGSVIDINGVIVNSGQSEAKQLEILLIAYDTEDRVTGFWKYPLSQTLLPGEDLAYAYSLIPPGGLADKINVQIYAYR